MIIVCKCHHAFQDEVYGRFRRVANPMRRAKDAAPKYRCTVCGETQQTMLNRPKSQQNEGT